jgi:hypothetical protein
MKKLTAELTLTIEVLTLALAWRSSLVPLKESLICL